MQPHHLKQFSIGVLLCLAFALGLALQGFVPFAHVTSAQGIVVTGNTTLSDPAAPAVIGARLTYQGRLTNNGGAPINATVSMVFRLYAGTGGLLWTSAPRTVTPVNGLFTVYLGDGADPNLSAFTLEKAASIGVTVGGDTEMTPRQLLNSVVGHSEIDAGVIGSSNSYIGVFGYSDSYIGVNGFSISGTGVDGVSFLGVGVFGSTNVITRAAVLEQNNAGAGPALEISNGGVKVTGAGIGTNTFAFIHRSSVANIVNNWTRIDNVLTNGDQNAMLFVTHVNNPTGAAGNDFNKALGVFYDAGAAKWSIYAEDTSAFPENITFNVMVIKR